MAKKVLEATAGVTADRINVAENPQLLKLLRGVKSNATDEEARQLIQDKLKL